MFPTIQAVGTVLASVVGGLATKVGRLTAPVVELLRGNREQRINMRAYFLWEQAGCPVGRDLDFWRQASRLEPRWLWPGRLRGWLGTQKNALSTSTSGMRTSVRADTLAAIASAIGAVVSAAVAVYALTFVARQESISRQQVEATYESPLYPVQVASFARFRAAIDGVENVALGPHSETLQTLFDNFTSDELDVLLAGSEDQQDIIILGKIIATHLPEFRTVLPNMTTSAEEISLITPDPFSKLVIKIKMPLD